MGRLGERALGRAVNFKNSGRSLSFVLTCSSLRISLTSVYHRACDHLCVISVCGRQSLCMTICIQDKDMSLGLLTI